MKDNALETIIGFCVVLFCLAFVLFINFNYSNNKSTNNITLFAKFNNIEGVISGADIKISGIKVGTVKSISLNPETFLALVEMSVSDNAQLPVDSTVFVRTGNLVGGKYLEIAPGNDDLFLKSGDTLIFTQSSIIFEDLVGKMLLAFGKKQ